MKHNRPFMGKKISIIIPCMNRIEIFSHIFPRWLEQIYSNCQIVIVDYSSVKNFHDVVYRITNRYQVSLAYNEPFSEAKCLILRLENQEIFNMSHAINYGIKNTRSDVVMIAGTETLPLPYYTYIAMNVIDNKTFTRCIVGRLCAPRRMFEEINGYPEICEYWGAEDDIVSTQLRNLGYRLRDLSYLFAFNMAHYFCTTDCLPYFKKFTRSYHRSQKDILDPFDGAKINSARFKNYANNFSKVRNNYELEYGSISPVLIKPEDDVDIEKIKRGEETGIYKEINFSRDIPYYGKRCAIIIPCMNRENDLYNTLGKWVGQQYYNKQTIIVDYSSTCPVRTLIEEQCNSMKLKFSYNKFEYDADVVLFRIDNQNFFNISHAYNYAVKKIKADVISFVCADSCPWDFYLDLCMSVVDDYSFVQCHYGLHTISYDNWQKLNGHQEFIVGWGGEDDDFRNRCQLLGLTKITIPHEVIFQIPQDKETKVLYQQIPNIYESNNINLSRFIAYRTYCGFKGNYNIEIGRDKPVDFIPMNELSKMRYLTVCKPVSLKSTKNLPEWVQYNENYNLYFSWTEDLPDWNSITIPLNDPEGNIPYVYNLLLETEELEKYMKDIFNDCKP